MHIQHHVIPKIVKYLALIKQLVFLDNDSHNRLIIYSQYYFVKIQQKKFLVKNRIFMAGVFQPLNSIHF